MSDKTTNIRAAELGESLKKARTQKGLTLEQLGVAAGWGKPSTAKGKASKIESGSQIPGPEDLNAWARLTDTDPRLRAQWGGLAEQALTERSGSYEKRMANGQQPVQDEYTKLAAVTERFRFVETFVFPRYLQLPEYSRAVLEEYREKVGVINDVDRAVDARQASVRFLYDPTKDFKFLISEPVLRSRRFPASIMRPQLHSLLGVIGLSNVTLAVYPSLSRPVRTLLEGSFELMDDVGFMEGPLVDDKRLLFDDVAKLEKLFDRYMTDAAVNEDARTLILDAIAALPSE